MEEAIAERYIPATDLKDRNIRVVEVNEHLTSEDRVHLLAANFHLSTDGQVFIRRGVCRTLECNNTRWNSDQTGWCRDCKINLGLYVAPKTVSEARTKEERKGISQMPQDTINRGVNRFQTNVMQPVLSKDFMAKTLKLHLSNMTMQEITDGCIKYFRALGPADQVEFIEQICGDVPKDSAASA
jgi:hypothetical protein